MPQIIMTVGLPGSGKTTWAWNKIKQDPKHWVRISNDALREMSWGDPYESHDENWIADARQALIETAMSRGKSIIVDNLNINPKLETGYRALVERWNRTTQFNKYTFEVHFIDTPVEECIQRDALRNRPVGEMVIRRFARMLHKELEMRRAKANEVQQ